MRLQPVGTGAVLRGALPDVLAGPRARKPVDIPGRGGGLKLQRIKLGSGELSPWLGLGLGPGLGLGLGWPIQFHLVRVRVRVADPVPPG